MGFAVREAKDVLSLQKSTDHDKEMIFQYFIFANYHCS
jgi:hypothetical protein